jgi:membrane-associated protein
MSTLIEWFKMLLSLAKPEFIQSMVDRIGVGWVLALLAAIIFSETGLLIGFFLPGDSLLFAAGFLASQKVFPIVQLNLLLMVAAVVGDAVNYYLGLQMGEYVFEQGRLRFVKHKHLMAAKHFYEKHGGKAIVLARFVPIVRTFTPFVAGIALMSYRKFVIYNFVGGVGWVLSMTMAGYFLGQIEFIKKNFELAVLGIVAISVLPLMYHGLLAWWKARKERQATPALDK